jgi:hypothetical protein
MFQLMKIRSTLGVIKNQQAETLWNGPIAIEMPLPVISGRLVELTTYDKSFA